MQTIHPEFLLNTIVTTNGVCDGYTVVDIRESKRQKSISLPGSLTFSFALTKAQLRACERVGEYTLIYNAIESLCKTLRQSTSTHVVLISHSCGYREQQLAQALSHKGFNVSTVEGGMLKVLQYIRTYNYALPKLTVLCGYTGSKKTELLKSLTHKGLQVISIAEIAKHRGSGFGVMGTAILSSDQVALNLFLSVVALDSRQVIYTELEPPHVGSIHVPENFRTLYSSATKVWVDVSVEQRCETILSEYGSIDREELLKVFALMREQFTSEEQRIIVESIESGVYCKAVSVLVSYYDRQYDIMFEGLSIHKDITRQYAPR
ncbi:MAG: hypothetical protein OCD01_05140 [Fibrobacterales bacterium]